VHHEGFGSLLLNLKQARTVQMWKAALATLQRTTAWWKAYPHPWSSANPGSGPTNPSKKWGNRASTTVSGVAACEGLPLVLGQSAPDSGVLTGLNSPSQAGLNHLASTADGLCFLCPDKRGAVVPDRKEQLGVQAEAGSTVTPSHQDRAPCIEIWGEHHGSQLGPRTGGCHWVA
jgi:hypothetical protein